MDTDKIENKASGRQSAVDTVVMWLGELVVCFLCITPGIIVMDIYGLTWLTPIPIFIGGQAFQAFLTRNKST